MDLERGLGVPWWRDGNGTRSGEPLWLDNLDLWLDLNVI